ncbi:hypothetical protein OF83DRAFT_538981 [Amylostereum chailletii]|nr:hypothetical protein OF83DRAFT_538981 [Amylostereum chailletii]
MVKRKRSQRDASAEDAAAPSSAASPIPTPSTPEQHPATDDSVDGKAEKTAESIVWDAFREEHHEVFEQLPLYLHRSYALIRELDVQANDHSDEMLATLHKYIRMRQTVAQPSAGPGPPSARAPIDLAHPPRALLPRISWLLDESVRTTEEKASIAAAAQLTLERHIALLDRAIADQETALALGLRHGTHPALLQDPTAPRWQRVHRVVHSPVPELENPYRLRPPTPDDRPPPAPAVVSAPPPPKRGRGHRKQPEKQPPPPPTEAPVRSSSGLKLKLKPLAAALKDSPSPYCHCGRDDNPDNAVMLGCDNPRCKKQWFHLSCVGLTEVPKSRKWYCSDNCRKAGPKRKR